MPDIWEVQDPSTGEVYEVEGDAPPSGARLRSILATMRGNKPQPRQPPTGGLIGGLLSRPGVPEMVDKAKDFAVNNAPMIGGMAGGLAGSFFGPPCALTGRLVGAGVGGAIGEGFKKAATDDEPESMTETALDVVKSGAEQALWEGTGAAVVKGASAGSKWLMNRAMNRVSDRLMSEFPGMTDDMIQRAITVSKGGLKKARAILSQAKAQANTAIQMADNAGVTIPVTAATDGLTKTLTKVANTPDIDGNLRALVKVERQILSGRGQAMTVAEADALKASLQSEARGLYRALARGDGRPAFKAMAEAKMDMAAALNEAIEQATKRAGASAYRASNAEAQRMIGVTRGLTRAMSGNQNLYQAMVRPGVGAILGGASGYAQGGSGGAAIGSVLGGTLGMPSNMSRAALAFARPEVQAALRQAPRLTAGAVQDVLE
jgi:hypothetical protein